MKEQYEWKERWQFSGSLLVSNIKYLVWFRAYLGRDYLHTVRAEDFWGPVSRET